MAQPSPHDVRRRILRISKTNGWSVAIIAGLGALVSLLLGDPIGLGVGLLVMLGGITELRGRGRLLRHDIDGMRLLVRAQMIVLGVVWVYAVSRLGSFDAAFALSNQTPEMRQILTEIGVDTAELVTLLRLAFYVLYGSVMLVTLIYQGGLALYYHRRMAAVQEAIANPVVAPTTS